MHNKGPNWHTTVGIVGGGITGLILAYRLAAAGFRVTVLEKDEQLGGLATYQRFRHFDWDKFYHVILPSDTHLLTLLSELGLGSDLVWSTTKTGFYVDGRVHSVSNAAEFLRFPPLSLWSKTRLLLTILYCAHIENWRRLEKIPLEPWLIRLSGRAAYAKLWRPLLLAKLGENYQRVSAVFIWSYIKRMFSARDASASREQLGHARGGYKQIIDRLSQHVVQAGGSIETGVVVQNITGHHTSGLTVATDHAEMHFDKVVCTSPINILRRVAGKLVQVPYVSGDVEYLGVVCLILVSRVAITPFYVLNIADPDIPFTGVLGISNVVPPTHTAGLHITYLPKYVLSTDPLLREADEHIVRSFRKGLHCIFPRIRDEEIVEIHVNRAFKVQPLQVLNYSALVPNIKTNHPDFFVLNTSQFTSNTLNNNEVVKAVDQFMERNIDELRQGLESKKPAGIDNRAQTKTQTPAA